jgi:hypothetical protein
MALGLLTPAGELNPDLLALATPVDVSVASYLKAGYDAGIKGTFLRILTAWAAWILTWWADKSGSVIALCAIDDSIEPYATDPEQARQLWELSERLVGEQFAY